MKDKIEKEDIFKKMLMSNDKIFLKKEDYVRFINEYRELYPEGKHTKLELSPELQYKIDEHGKLCDSLKTLYATKNADYGDSMHPLFEEYGLTAFFTSMSSCYT